ncbi:hydroxyacid dehydrogenase [Lachnospiraceae bacterium WCA-9-b2]|jgi:D-3-phosphoglycerate dehydrogenase|uniref:Hydroxyacid dehydrogenase n=1 Tax=Sporofaciens musculi TaxID=2681861 RepID=A0A7X3MGB1_9FIRM|nr:NAD(P)-dependent oxidoreductase [Sporofaciens musculi]MCI8362984.1 hydroxyacid dehydrogenase [Clostridia bacterium]MXP75888.1 hydroxyacid dehydrogenase [Sporofaciens musculi]
MKVAVGASSFSQSSDRALRLLTDKGIEVVKNPYGRKMTVDETIRHLQGADGLLAGLELLNEDVLSKAPTLKAIARIGIGMDNVDIEAVKRRKIALSNTPDAPTEAVAEMTMAALLAIGHKLIQCNDEMHRNIWKKHIGFSLKNLNVLLIGYGRIGKRVKCMLNVFGSNIKAYDEYLSGYDTDLEQKLAWADVISLHASGNKEVLTPERFGKMKNGVVILNSARGALLNEQALVEALESGRVSYFWGDVFWQEPYEGKLQNIENAILTPHIATYNSYCRETMEVEAVENLLYDLEMAFVRMEG